MMRSYPYDCLYFVRDILIKAGDSGVIPTHAMGNIKFFVINCIKMNADEKLHLITRNLQEVLGEDRLKEILPLRDVKIYWGTATTGRPHVAYFLPLVKIGDFLKAGCEVTILFADLHAYLDNLKAPWDLLALRAQYYEYLIKEMLKAINVPLDKLKFIKGTNYQLSKEYTLDVYKMLSLVSEHDAKKAGSEVVKQVEHPLLSGLVYPLLQALDEEYLHVDAQFGGVDQRKIFTFAEKYLPSLGYSKRIHLMNPMVPGLTGTKMSSSEDDSKIDMLDSPQILKNKIKKAFCEPGNIHNNGILSFLKFVLFPLSPDGSFLVERSQKNGGDILYSNFAKLELDFEAMLLHPADLKQAVYKSLEKLLEPVRAAFQSPEMVKLVEAAYGNRSSNFSLEKNMNGLSVNSHSTPAGDDLIDPSKLDFRIGKIIDAKNVMRHPTSILNLDHPESPDHLYIVDVDLGETLPRSIVSNMAEKFSRDDIMNKIVIVLCNLKPTKFKGVQSNGLILCANKPELDKKELIEAPPGSKIGDKVYFENYREGVPEMELKPKKKLWERFQANLISDDEHNLVWNKCKMMTNNGPVSTKILKNATIG